MLKNIFFFWFIHKNEYIFSLITRKCRYTKKCTGILEVIFNVNKKCANGDKNAQSYKITSSLSKSSALCIDSPILLLGRTIGSNSSVDNGWMNSPWCRRARFIRSDRTGRSVRTCNILILYYENSINIILEFFYH